VDTTVLREWAYPGQSHPAWCSDVLIVKADRRDPFVLFRLSLAAEVTKLRAE
jgi:hypothetical protein